MYKLGLNIQETSNQDGSPKFIVKKIEGRNAEDIGVFQQYNDIIKLTQFSNDWGFGV